VTPVQAAAVDRALTADDPRTARRHLRLVAALDGTTPAGPLATAAAVTLAVGATAERPGPPAPPTPGARADDPAVRGAAVAVARFDRSLDAVTTGTGLPRAAVRRALAEV
jgi:hypothetical protein